MTTATKRVRVGVIGANPKGGWEYPVYLVVTAAVVALLGGGRIAVSKPAE